MDHASFITTENADDLIVSFAIPLNEHGDVKSMTLLRTPKYEFVLDESERGVRVFVDDLPDDEIELLDNLTIENSVVTITTNYRTYTVGIKNVDHVEIDRSKRIIKKMNYDRRFKLKTV